MEGREYHNNLLVRDGRNHYYYDPAGRLIRKVTTRISRKPAVWHYRYNAFDQLTDVYTPEREWWQYEYDALARRISKSNFADNGASTLAHVTFTNDDDLVIEQIAGKDSITRWQYIPEEYTLLTQTKSQPTTSATSSGISITLSDPTGSPDQLIEASSANSTAVAYRSLWGVTSWAGEDVPPHGFPGQFFDNESGLKYNRFRMYDSHVGRFTTLDPLGLAPAANPSTYPHNPTMWQDPLGLNPDYRQPTYGNGGHIDNISASEAQRIQNAANLRGVEISVVGSRAAGTSHGYSDWDYVISDINSRTRSRIQGSLPQGPHELGAGRRIDIFTGRLVDGEPYITFYPN
ncbi:RHS repeat-associated core domain-containing protein [Nocardia coubleae]|uniref:RHS repeat-associated core domain-containing protein n=3 Tax=Nocardia coubleae TaxID=356147 RepID=A0A846W696_9NOCA|nr:RHS repeat-associated core domain-containing protein [Nocardia coubleae]